MVLSILGWALIIVGFLVMIVNLIFHEKRSMGETLFIMQFLLPKRPMGKIGNVMVILGAIILVFSKYFLQ